MNRLDTFADTIDKLATEGNLRYIPVSDTASGTIDMSSNDYLALACRNDLQEEFFQKGNSIHIPLTSSASRLLAGRQDEYSSLESMLSELYNRPVLLFNSGYHANTGIVSAIAKGTNTLIVADKLVHASIIDGITLSKAAFVRFRHNDLNHLEKILAKEAKEYSQVLLIVESVYSMDGDRADIARLVDIKKAFDNVILYVDEAHAFGVEGNYGLGISRSSESYSDIDIVMGTFGKACASMGAFCAVVSDKIRTFLINRARSFIFSTALPPISMAWTQFMIGKFIAMDNERAHLREIGQQLSDILRPLSPKFDITPSHIQPFVTGDPNIAVELSHKLLDHGFKVLPIRTPTVPPGTDRLRISLNSALTSEDISRFGNSLRDCISELDL